MPRPLSIEEFDEYMRLSLLKDIARNMYETAEMNKIRSRHVFNHTAKIIDEIIESLRREREGLHNDYKKRYGVEPDIEVAKRLFLEDKAAHECAGREARNADHHDPESGQETVGA